MDRARLETRVAGHCGIVLHGGARTQPRREAHARDGVLQGVTCARAYPAA
jgi:hypothetical protein